MDEFHEYKGKLTFNVTEGKRGAVILHFLRGDEVVTEIHLTRSGAKRLAWDLRESTL